MFDAEKAIEELKKIRLIRGQLGLATWADFIKILEAGKSTTPDIKPHQYQTLALRIEESNKRIAFLEADRGSRLIELERRIASFEELFNDHCIHTTGEPACHHEKAVTPEKAAPCGSEAGACETTCGAPDICHIKPHQGQDPCEVKLQDYSLHGVAIEKDGKRIDPKDFYKPVPSSDMIKDGELEYKFNQFIKKWCMSVAHLMDSDENDAEDFRKLLRSHHPKDTVCVPRLALEAWLSDELPWDMKRKGMINFLSTGTERNTK